jgi:hypothetical protein
MWHALVCADGFRAGLPLEAILTDDRITVKDGGVDVLVTHGTTAKAHLLPERPSIWSVKSGKTAISTSTLKKELRKTTHPDLVAKWRSGSQYVYCVCEPTSPSQCDALAKAANALCAREGLPSDRITLFFVDHLCQGLMHYPAVLQRFYPQLGLQGALTHETWGKSKTNHFNAGAKYVDFDDRARVMERVRRHLTSRDDPAVLHLAGLSGIGKTRLVYEACADPRLHGSILYFPTFIAAKTLVDRLRQEPECSAMIVIDEVSLTEYSQLRDGLADLGDRVRCVSIGPGTRSDRSNQQVVVLPPPSDARQVIDVLRANSPPQLSDSALHQIAKASSSDLRFALLLLQVVLQDPSLSLSPETLAQVLMDSREIFNRILRLFSNEEGVLDENFRTRYQWLTLGAHVGVSEPRKEELEFIATQAGAPAALFQKTVGLARRCGLGEVLAHMFEAVPRGLATSLFAQELWPEISHRFSDVLKAVPNDSFLRAIMQRVEMCPEHVREEVLDSFDGHFRTVLGPPSLEAIESEERTRTVRRWVELSPNTGLDWLTSAIERSSIERLRSFSGAGWASFGPRREIVWLLEHLACFCEHFHRCEPLLFQLALAENEQCANNATGIWCEKFRVYLSNTEVPFPQRCDVLIDRLKVVDAGSADLLLRCLVSALTRPHSVMAPPEFIGGRLVPPEWRPDVDIYQLFVDLIRGALPVLSAWPVELRPVARRAVIAAIDQFYKQDTHDELVRFFEPSSDREERLALLAALRELANRLGRRRKDPAIAEMKERVERWASSLAPTELAERLKLLLSRHTWEFDREGKLDKDGWRRPYRAIVKELEQSPDVLVGTSTWIDSDGKPGARALGWTLGEFPRTEVFRPVIEAWLNAGVGLETACGYLHVHRDANAGQLPAWAADLLDGLAATRPGVAAKVTVSIDPSDRGLARVKSSTAVDPNVTRAEIGQMFGESWESVLGPTGQAWVLDQLWPDPPHRSPRNGLAALFIAEMYAYRKRDLPIERELLPPMNRLVHDPPDLDHSHAAVWWQQLALRLAKQHPEPVLETCLRRVLDDHTHRRAGDKEAITVISSIADRHPALVAERVILSIASQKHLWHLHIESWQAVFAKLPVEVVEKVIEREGPHAADRIGQYIPDPALNEDGTPKLPAITAWYLKTHGGRTPCFREFSIGRWNGRVRNGSASGRAPEIEALVAAYANHPIPALRRWASDLASDHEAALIRERAETVETRRW